MSDAPVRSHRAIAIAIVIAGVLISASVFIAVSGATRTVTYTETTTATIGDPPLSISNTLQGLDFLLTLNTSRLTEGQAVELNVTLTNTLSSYNNISVRGLPYSVSLGPCGTLNEPFGFLIAQGYYSAGNASSAIPLALYAPGEYPCPATLNLSYYSFQPDSYLVSACESGGMCVQFASTSSSAYSGSWAANGGISQSAFAKFKPGVYTVLAASETGQIDVLHFTVNSAT